MLETLRRGEEKLRELKEERDKLLEANRKLVQLVEELEDVMEYVEAGLEGSQFSIGDHVYDYGRGWTPREVMVEEDLEIDPDMDTGDIEEQLEQIRGMMERVERYKNQENVG